MRPALRLQAQWMPALEVTEREGEFYIAVDLPGLKKEDVKLEVTPEGLAIKGERKSEKTETAKGYFRSERVYGEFYRFVPLPEGALAENVDARFKDGVLEIHVPVIKPEKPTAKEIAIK
jgi:HSP20 family protein